MQFAATWMDTETAILSVVSQTEKDKYMIDLTGVINQMDRQLITLQSFKPMVFTATQTILP